MQPEVLTTAELLEQWREATRASELAERLARLAAESVERADRSATTAEEIARMAERAAKSAERAAMTARKAATRASAFARDNRDVTLAEADLSLNQAREDETAARDRYHESERVARGRQGL